MALRYSFNRPVDRSIVQRLLDTEFLDREYYLSENDDVRLSGVDPETHFALYGSNELRQPNKNFDPIAFLVSRPNFLLSAVNPFAVIDGNDREGLITRADNRTATSNDLNALVSTSLFDEDFYRESLGSSTTISCEPILHFLSIGASQNRDPSVRFESSFYNEFYLDIQETDWCPILHYLRHGRHEGRKCVSSYHEVIPGIEEIKRRIRESRLFDDEYYIRHCPSARHQDALDHYLQIGHTMYLSTSDAFDVPDYLARTPAARRSNLPPLVHFVARRDIQRLNDTSFPDADRSDNEGARDERWICQPDELPKADCNVNIERMRSVAFFRGFGFGWGGEIALGHVPEAIALLGRRNPPLTTRQDKPDMSIIIPVYGQLPCVLGCLDSLSKHASSFKAEIIVVDDCSPAKDGIGRISAIPWISYRATTRNGGFVASCNYGAQIAHADKILFLNSDTRVCAGWLDELIATFVRNESAALVGSKLYNYDGTLQEAGGLFWKDGVAWNYGRDKRSSDPLYCFARKTDYCSGASLAVRKSAFEEVGGFSSAYAPAYCEDADLAFALRGKGYETWFQALSRVIHLEGMTHGKDETKGIKSYQPINLRFFAKRWAQTLEKHGCNGEVPDREVLRSYKYKLLIIDAVTPTPDRDSGSVITFAMIQALMTMNFHISFVPAHNYLYDQTYTDELLRLGVRCYFAPFVHNIQEVVQSGGPFDYVLGYRVNVLEPLFETLREMLPSARIIFHNVDLHYLREQRQARMDNDRAMLVRAASTQTDELKLVALADAVIVHTQVEKDLIARYCNVDHVVKFPYIAENHRSEIGFEQRRHIVFLGGFAHTPNIDAVRFFAAEVWPVLEASLPGDAQFWIVGAAPPRSIEDLATNRIVVKGFVPDLASVFDNARVAVAPLRFGAGIKGKVVQSLAHGVPTVCSSIAAEGMELNDRKQVFVADTAETIVQSILDLYSDPVTWGQIREAGHDFVEENYGRQRSIDLCTEILDKADGRWIEREERRRKLLLSSLE